MSKNKPRASGRTKSHPSPPIPRPPKVGTSFEEAVRAEGYQLIAGLDEVGRVILPAMLRV
jgi:hypothetical protein